jgi:integrase
MGIEGQIVTDERVETDVQLVPATGGRSLFGVDVVWQDDELKRIAWNGAQELWLSGQESENTRRAYEIAYRQFFDWVGREPWEIGSALAQQWKAHLEDRELADSTINAKLAALSSFYTFVLRDYRVPTPDGRDVSLWAGHSNPFSAVKRKKVTPYGKAVFPTTDELKRILGAINTDCLSGRRDFAMLYTYATTCRRFSEIINLRWGDISEMEDGNYQFGYVAKGGATKRAVLNRLAYQAICAYLEADGRWDTIVAEDYIFVPLDPERIQRLRPDLPVRPNQPISNRTANGIFKKRARLAGVDEEKAHIHALRHAGLRLEVEEQKRQGSVDYVQVMELAGHSSLAVTQIYVTEVLDDPDDPGSDDRARALLPGGKRRRRKVEPKAEQEQLL